MFRNCVPKYADTELTAKLTGFTKDGVIDACNKEYWPCKWDKEKGEYKVNVKKVLKKLRTY